MDSRILELARQAGFNVRVSDDFNSQTTWHGQAHNDTFEKFAELVADYERKEIAKFPVVLNVKGSACHMAADMFWDYWRKNGETHKHGYYESTWGAINAALSVVGVVQIK